MAEKSSSRTVPNLIGALAITCAAAVAFYVAVVPRGDGDGGPPPVSYSQELGQARRTAPYPVAAPEGLPDDWKPNSVTYEGGGAHGTTWHLGFVTPDKQYVAVEQGSERPRAFIEKVTQGARPTGKTQRVAGEEWARYTGSKYDALVHEDDGVTTVVTGTGTFGQLAKLAGSLRAEKA